MCIHFFQILFTVWVRRAGIMYHVYVYLYEISIYIYTAHLFFCFDLDVLFFISAAFFLTAIVCVIPLSLSLSGFLFMYIFYITLTTRPCCRYGGTSTLIWPFHQTQKTAQKANKKPRGTAGIEPATSRTQSENHTTRPSSH